MQAINCVCFGGFKNSVSKKIFNPMNQRQKVQFLCWDSQFFRRKTGKIELPESKNNSYLQTLLTDAKQDYYELIYLFTNDKHHVDKDILDALCGKLVDRKVYFRTEIGNQNFSTSEIVSFKGKYNNKDLLSLAYQSGEYSRFKTDKRLNNNEYEILYRNWIEKSIKHEIADEVFVFSEKNTIKAMVTLAIKDNIGHIGLIAVDESLRGKGIGKKLIHKVCDYLKSKNIFELKVQSQFQNKEAYNFYINSGFYVEKIERIYHFWLK